MTNTIEVLPAVRCILRIVFSTENYRVMTFAGARSVGGDVSGQLHLAQAEFRKCHVRVLYHPI